MAEGCRNLTILNANHTQISDESLKSIAQLPELQHLDLANTAITDEGLAHLEGLSQLQSLDVTSTEVTAEGIAALQHALPDCSIAWDDVDHSVGK